MTEYDNQYCIKNGNTLITINHDRHRTFQPTLAHIDIDINIYARRITFPIL